MTDTPADVLVALARLDTWDPRDKSAAEAIRTHIADLERQLAEARADAHDQRWQHAQELKRAESLESQLAAQRERDGRDAERLNWLINNCATLETDGEGNWRVCYGWTSPETYGPYAKSKYAAIDAALKD